jgi:cell division protein FtsW (lipid II flippase)
MFFVVFTVGAAFGFLVVANMIVKSQGQSYWADEREQERYRMRRMTFLLFQLFLAIFASYAVIYHFPNENLLVPLTCLIAMFLLAKHPQARPEIIIDWKKQVLLSAIS